jgi:hypothetical protein
MLCLLLALNNRVKKSTRRDWEPSLCSLFCTFFLKMLATLRVTAQLTFAVLSLVLFGVSCGALVSDDLQGNSAIAVLAFVSGLSTLMVPGMYVFSL